MGLWAVGSALVFLALLRLAEGLCGNMLHEATCVMLSQEETSVIVGRYGSDAFSGQAAADNARGLDKRPQALGSLGTRAVSRFVNAWHPLTVLSDLALRTVDFAVACPASTVIRRRLLDLHSCLHGHLEEVSPDCLAGLLFNASGRWTMQEKESVRSGYVQGREWSCM